MRLNIRTMGKRSEPHAIRLKGVRQNNLKNFDLSLPLGRLILITGLSGSGKSSLAFDTLYAEGQRRYIETFSPYARQFFDRMDKPQVDSIEGIPPAIALEQRNSVRSTRSTVGTMTEICDHMKIVWSHLSQLHCHQCGEPVRKDEPPEVWKNVRNEAECASDEPEAWVVFELPISERLSLSESLALIAKQGYQRLLVGTQMDTSALPECDPGIVRIDDAASLFGESSPTRLTIIQDRIQLRTAKRSRFIEACEHAYHFGKGKLQIWYPAKQRLHRYSNRLHCSQCDIEYREPSPALFSFNHPLGACPTCRGFGRTIAINYDQAIPDHSLSLSEGAVKPWQTGVSAECQRDMLKFCRIRKVPVNIPFRDLPSKWQSWVIDGDPEYGKDPKHEWPKAWYGVKGYFRWLESKSYKMHVRVLLSRYRVYEPCRDCAGRRFRPEPLWHKIHDRTGRLWTIADFYTLPVSSALPLLDEFGARSSSSQKGDALEIVIDEVRSRLRYLSEVGLGYLTLDRATRTLSGGETERVNLTTCLGTRLVNTLFVLDEPSVGLHARDTARLVGILQQLRDVGNTVVVVEHDPHVIRIADHVVDLGPGRGESGGHVVFQGNGKELIRSPDSLTGQYLCNKKRIEVPQRRPIDKRGHNLRLSNVSLHNLKNLTVEFPLNRFVCVTGVSGSGKTSLVRGVLMPALETIRTNRQIDVGNDHDEENGGDTNTARKPGGSERFQAQLTGNDRNHRAIMVDQSALGKTPRSNPSVYIGAFDSIRELFARTELSKQRGLKASSFSFNSAQGQCEACRGAGFEKIEMQFLSDVFIRCSACNGRRYRSHILEIKLAPTQSTEKSSDSSRSKPATGDSPVSKARKTQLESRSTGDRDHSGWNIADLLDATVDEVVRFLRLFTESNHAARAIQSLELLQEVGLGYLRAGQPINTLSGGESQRIKLVSHLAEFARTESEEPSPTLLVFDEPTTGLHFDDVAVLLKVFQRLVDAGHTVLVVEHNLDVIKCADWVIDLGPEAGDQGGQIVVQGTPEKVAGCGQSHTGRALLEIGISPNQG